MRYDKSLSSLMIIYSIGNFSSKFLSFFFIFFITYFLNKDSIGKYDLILNTVALIVPLFSLQIGASLYRWLTDNSRKESKSFIFVNVFTLLFWCIVTFTLVFLGLHPVFSFEFSIYIYFISTLQIVLTVLQQGLRGMGHTRLYVASGFLYSVSIIIVSVLLFYFFNPVLEGLLIANTASLFLVISYLIFRGRFFKYFTFRLSRELIKSMLRYSLPLMPNGFIWWVIVSANRYIILYFLGIEANGIFAISYKWPAILMMLSDIFYLAWQDKLLRIPDNENSSLYMSDILQKYVNFLFTTIILLSCTCRKLMYFIVEDSFFEAWKYIPVLLYAVLLQSISAFYGSLYLKRKNTKQAFLSSIWGAVITMCFAWLSVMWLGLHGISIAILLGFIAMLVIRIYGHRDFAINFYFGKFAFLTIVYATISMSNLSDNIFVFLLSCTLSLFLFFYLNKDLFKLIKTGTQSDFKI